MREFVRIEDLGGTQNNIQISVDRLKIALNLKIILELEHNLSVLLSQLFIEGEEE